jgi:quercetin dioxygenase-like cupin family protein
MSQNATTAQIRRPQHVCWSQIPTESVTSQFQRQIVVGDRIMIARLTLKKGCLVPRHSHFHEQISQVQQGALQFTLDEGQFTVRAGELLCIPPHLSHTVLALEDTICIDTFVPPREDWLNKTDHYLRQTEPGS